jgi:peptidoglycan/xylan/chitin deacetylase (PgdA/CDA1 family)
MMRAIAKIAARLDFDKVANSFVEPLYRNTNSGGGRLSRRFQILIYHRVSPERHPFFEPMHPAIFERQIGFLRRCYSVMPLSEIVERSQQGEIPKRAVAITFDDGYRDSYEFAFPILKKYRVPATVFVTTGVIETGEVLWHDRIFDAFRFATVERARLDDSELHELNLAPGDIHRSVQSVRYRLRALHGEPRKKLIEQIEQKLKPRFPANAKPRMLTWAQIREMHQAGIEFGSHTVSHPILSQIPKASVLWEVCESKRHLSEQLGVPVSSFAYPNGSAADYNNDVKDALRASGYAYAVTTRAGVNRAFDNPFELKRDLPWQSQIELFRLNFFLQRHELVPQRRDVRH